MQVSGSACEHFRISIHAPREGRDYDPLPKALTPITISIHAPREGRDAGPFQVDDQ